VVLPGVSAAGTRGVSASGSVPLPSKTVGTRWDYALDLTARIPAGDTVASVALGSVGPAGLPIVYLGGWGKLAVIWIDVGGTPGQSYAIDLIAMTAQGRVIELLATVTVINPGQGAAPAQIQVVQVALSYIQGLIAAAQAAANEALILAQAALLASSSGGGSGGSGSDGAMFVTQAGATLVTQSGATIISASISGGAMFLTQAGAALVTQSGLPISSSSSG
jgi:hypothetical protein